MSQANNYQIVDKLVFDNQNTDSLGAIAEVVVNGAIAEKQDSGYDHIVY